MAAAMGSAFAQEAAKAAPTLTATEKEQAKKIYFERCAGCHGVLRKGATGKNLEPHWTKTLKDGTKLEGGTTKLGTGRLEKIIGYGTEGGMVNFDDILTKEEINLMARYIQEHAGCAAGVQLQGSAWILEGHRAGRQRPKKQMNKHQPQEHLLGDAARHRRGGPDRRRHQGNRQHRQDRLRGPHLPLSASGRYVYVIGRDGRLSLIDLWMEKPAVVAEVKIGFDARSIDTSKFKGFEDKYAIAGSYWPPQYTIMDGDTLKPLKVVSTRGMTVDGEYHPEPRVASIVASFTKPEWVINIKETGQILLVDYSDIENLKTTTIGSAKFLHDGGWDASKRYFLVAANASNKIAAVDTKTGKLAALVDVAKIPHPGRGANFVHPQFGPVWATGHLGADVVTLISTPSDDPSSPSTRSTTGRSCRKSSTCRATCSSRPIRSPSTSGPIRRRTRTRTWLNRSPSGTWRPVQAEGHPERSQGFRPAGDQGGQARGASGIQRRRQGSVDLPVGRQDRPVGHRGV
jgi:nitrite reductase (NO-forming)/hydroxylamine reductase